MGLLIAARQSDLARLQAYKVGERLQQLGETVRYHFRESLGDINQEDPLWQMPEKGVFTEDFRVGLEKGEWDLVVHSWKDLPIDPLPLTEIVATLPRADARDIFLFKKKHLPKKQKDPILRVFSSSPRRIHNLTPFLKTSFPGPLQAVEFSDVRGNILTRIRKMIEDDSVDGLIVAKAALDRLLLAEAEEFRSGQEMIRGYLEQCLWQVLPLSQNPTAAAQGALAVEIRKDRSDLKALLEQIHCPATWEAAGAERQILKAHGGGCHQRIGVTQYNANFGTVLFLKGETEAGEPLDKVVCETDQVQLTRPYCDPLQLFDREALAFERDTSCNAHFVARTSALPEGEALPEGDVLWVSGVETWRKLAKRGYWVSGCSDSLGEEQSLGADLVSLKSDLKWAKWTHDRSVEPHGKQVFATYRLVEKAEVPDLSSYKDFYWMSGTQFLRAIQVHPELLRANHYCGPGHTFTMISKVLKDHQIEKKPQRLSSRQVWLKAIEEFQK